MNRELRILLLFLAVILTPISLAAEETVVFKLVKPMKLVGSEKLDFTVTFQDGYRIKTAVDESKPFCQVFFNSDTILSHHGNVGPLSMSPAATAGIPNGIRVLPGVAKTTGFVSVQFSASKAQAFPDKDSFSISCSLFSEEANKVSLFTYEQISKILGSTFEVISATESKRDVAEDLK
jgi:hypothetical protein